MNDNEKQIQASATVQQAGIAHDAIAGLTRIYGTLLSNIAQENFAIRAQCSASDALITSLQSKLEAEKARADRSMEALAASTKIQTTLRVANDKLEKDLAEARRQFGAGEVAAETPPEAE